MKMKRGARRLAHKAISALSRKTIAGHQFTLAMREPDLRQILDWRPSWKTELIRAALSARNGAFLDIGVNIGQTMLDYIAADRRTRYVGFEPSPSSAAVVTSLIERNRLADCSIVPVALSSRNAVASLHLRIGNSTDAAASLVADLRPDWNTERSYVPCFRLDDIYSEVLGADRPSLVKIDVEGAELDAIKGMIGLLNSSRPFVLCEVLRRDRHADAASHVSRCQELITVLASLRYAVFAIRRSADDRKVLALEAIAAFPSDVWTIETATTCDYLFIPAEKTPPLFD